MHAFVQCVALARPRDGPDGARMLNNTLNRKVRLRMGAWSAATQGVDIHKDPLFDCLVTPSFVYKHKITINCSDALTRARRGAINHSPSMR